MHILPWSFNLLRPFPPPSKNYHRLALWFDIIHPHPYIVPETNFNLQLFIHIWSYALLKFHSFWSSIDALKPCMKKLGNCCQFGDFWSMFLYFALVFCRMCAFFFLIVFSTFKYVWDWHGIIIVWGIKLVV